MTADQIKARVKVHLLKGKTLTAIEAFNLWRTLRLSVYIHRLRNDGVKIKTEMVKKGNKVFAKYSAV